MCTIQTNTALRELSTLLDASGEPVVVQDGGRDVFAVISIDVFNRLYGMAELDRMLAESRAAIAEGKVRPWAEVHRDLKEAIANGTI